MDYRTFWLEEMPHEERYFYTHEPGSCPVHGAEHRAETACANVPGSEVWPSLGAACPQACDCGHIFAARAERGGSGRRVFRRLDTGEELSKGKLPPGALVVSSRKGGPIRWPNTFGSDGLSVACVMPDGHWWHIDGRASNCTRVEDDVHRCWVRHGTFGETVHVDKAGETCSAGAGSILWPMPDGGTWHGFLHNGVLRQC